MSITNFTLEEFLHSDTAEKNNINNFPDTLELIYNLLHTLEQLQLIRDYINEPIYINSGFRCESLEKILCDKDFRKKLSEGKVKDWNEYFLRKQHPKAEAGDIRTNSLTPLELAIKINKSGVSYDQLIVEHKKDVSWVHISFSKGNNRKEFLEIIC